LKAGEFCKEAAQVLCLERVTIAGEARHEWRSKIGCQADEAKTPAFKWNQYRSKNYVLRRRCPKNCIWAQL